MIYLDNSSTTKPDAKAVEAALSAMENFGNPSSPHSLGGVAASMVREARKNVSSAMKCQPAELFFTSGGSESNNTAILGLAQKNSRHSKRIVTTDSEHPSVEEPLLYLEKNGYEIIRIPTVSGKLDFEMLQKALSQKTCLVTMMQANNETGALYDLEKIREEIDESGCGSLFHSDCVQSFMKVSEPFSKYCDAASVSAHKIGGLKGCGGLYLKKGLKIEPFVKGGGQESGFRSGTENTVGIMAFSAAVKAWNDEKSERNSHILGLKNILSQKLIDSLGERVVLNLPEKSVCSVLNFSIPGIKSETVINSLSADGIFVSASSACSTHAKENRILKAFGLERSLAESAIRVGITYSNTEEEISVFCNKVVEISKKLLQTK